MKKVDEGVELFDDIWEKVYSAEQQNQKEKYEMDLKKEIKKLQRLRDQIKTWIGSSDIKDKDPLIEARKLIETKMEQFKICEKETKTKTYSKEGLARQEKLDPTEEAKLNTTTWLGEYIERIAEEIEEKDFEIERLSAGKGKKTNKHGIEQMQQHIANHKFHMSKLEGIIRLVNNDVVDAEAVDQIKDDLDFYLDSYQEEEYMQTYDEEYIYETLGLDDLDIVNVDRVTNPEPVKKSTDDTASTNSKGSKNKKVSKASSLASVIPMTIGRARTIKENEELQSKEADLAKEMEEKAKATPTPVKVTRSGSTTSSQSTGSGTPAPTRTPTATPSPAHSGGTSMAAILKRETEQQEKERQKVCSLRLQRRFTYVLYSRLNCVLTLVLHPFM
jgi:CCR4-NOT transcription complex subunit 3